LQRVVEVGTKDFTVEPTKDRKSLGPEQPPMPQIANDLLKTLSKESIIPKKQQQQIAENPEVKKAVKIARKFWNEMQKESGKKEEPAVKLAKNFIKSIRRNAEESRKRMEARA